MCGGVREKTVEEELQELDLDQHDRARILRKYLDERNKEREGAHCEVRRLENETARLRTEIKALVGYIQFKDYE